MTMRFMVPPTWPAPPAGWVPPQNWQAPAEWGPAPAGWQFWSDDALASVPVAAVPATPAGVIARRSWWRRLGWLLVLVGGLVAYFAVNQTMLSTQNIIYFPTLLLIGAVTVPATVLMLEYAIGQGLDGHGGLIMATAVGAGILGVIVAGGLESQLSGQDSQVLLGVAVIEETAKMLVPLVIFLVARRRLPRLGLALGIAAGGGFAVLETMGYAFYALIARNGGLAAMEQTLQLRALLAPASHIAWTGMVAYALWRLGSARRRPFAVAGLVVAFVAAVGLHYLWDLSDDNTAHVVLAVVSVGILVTLMVLSARREAALTLSGPATGPAALAPVAQPVWNGPFAAAPVAPVVQQPYAMAQAPAPAQWLVPAAATVAQGWTPAPVAQGPVPVAQQLSAPLVPYVMPLVDLSPTASTTAPAGDATPPATTITQPAAPPAPESRAA